MDRRDKTNHTLPGRLLHITPITDLFGEGSFDHPFEAPWATLITNSGNLSTGLQQAWSHLQTSFQEVATAGQEAALLTQDVSRAGFYVDRAVAPSVTKALTVELELEKARAKSVGAKINSQLQRGDYER